MCEKCIIRTFEDVPDFLIGVHVLLEEALDLFLVVCQLVRRDCDDVLANQSNKPWVVWWTRSPP